MRPIDAENRRSRPKRTKNSGRVAIRISEEHLNYLRNRATNGRTVSEVLRLIIELDKRAYEMASNGQIDPQAVQAFAEQLGMFPKQNVSESQPAI